jgi:hypothetical protein
MEQISKGKANIAAEAQVAATGADSGSTEVKSSEKLDSFSNFFGDSLDDKPKPASEGDEKSEK